MTNDWIRLFLRVVFVYLVPMAVMVVVLVVGLAASLPIELLISFSVVLYVLLTWCMHFGLQGPEAWLAKWLFPKQGKG